MSTRWREALTKLRRQGGAQFWRGLDELAGSPDFRLALTAEFPGLSSFDWSRRGVLRAFGASLAIAGLGGCEASPDDRALSYVADPENVVPGRPKLYATGVPFAGIVQPVLGLTHVGRPTKLEGNPDHPASRGATDAFTQAALLDLYDPERTQTPSAAGQPVGWPEFDAALAGRVALSEAALGEGFRLLTGATTSPTLQRQLKLLLARWPAARWHIFEPVDDSGLHAATTLAFGRPLDVTPLFDRAHAVVPFDADPLGPGPRQVTNSRAWSERRRAFQAGDGSAVLMVAEPTPTLTGARSLDRLAAETSRVPLLVSALARVFGVSFALPALSAREQSWIERAAKLLAATRGKGLVLVGPDQPAATQALAWEIDERLDNLAATSRFSAPLRPTPPPDRTLATLVADMQAGRVQTLAIVDSNPVYASPLGRELAHALKRVPFSFHTGLWHDETGQACKWHAPLAHPLESWSDGRAADGTGVICQPLVRPFYDVRPLHTMVAALGGEFGASDHTIVQQTWTEIWTALQPNWDQALVKGMAPEPPTPALPAPPVRPAAASLPPPIAGLELLVRPDPTVWDGRLANNPWAQESPKPVTTLTWDNAVLIAPSLAAKLNVEDGDEVTLSCGGASVVGATWVMPGQSPRTVLVHRGYGRRFGEISKGAGFDVTSLLGRSGKVSLSRTGRHRELAAAQEQHAIDGKDMVRAVDFIDTAPRRTGVSPPSFWPDKPLKRPNWGMSIDLDLCTGCGACVTACIAENNIPMVGREEVRNGRRLHWLRIDRYYEGDPEHPLLHTQPVPCMHCEDAPCEMGCPVNASVHSPEGLNLQVYNRCVGTRTCSSYCPYKVRRFNWANYSGGEPESVQAQRNPEVTVRARGVMEKCTYCIQRISAARIEAKIAGHPIADGAVKTACQQVCPTGAISFGDIADPSAEVVKRKASPRDYALLEEANTRPRTTYRARIRSEHGDG
jgi:molybdopterin-containing oxidoreductase family iron-sulfur binding subunit